MFNFADEVEINVSEKLMIQAGAKYVNLGTNLKPPLCNKPKETLSKGHLLLGVPKKYRRFINDRTKVFCLNLRI